MTLDELKAKIKDAGGWSYEYSEEALDSVVQILNDKEENPETDVYDLVWEVIDEAFIYYNDAFDYLKETNTFDFEDAIREGFGKNVSTIASYYLEQEVYELLGLIKAE